MDRRTRKTRSATLICTLLLASGVSCAPAVRGADQPTTRASSTAHSHSVSTPGDPALPSLFVVGHLDRFAADASGGLDDRLHRMALIDSLGFTGTRLAFDWNRIEPDPGHFRWAIYDSIVGELGARGLRAYGMLGYSARWARPPGAPVHHRPTLHGSAAAGDTAFAVFAAAVARHFEGQVDRWEIWNEPNARNFWIGGSAGSATGPDPADYVALFRLARDSILAANPKAQVATGGLAPGPSGVPNVAVLRPEFKALPAPYFLRKMFQAGLVTDIVSVHPYTNRPPTASSHNAAPMNPVVNGVISVLDEMGHTSIKLWITEWGVADDSGLSDPEYRTWFDNGLTALVCNPRVSLTTIYSLSEGATGSTRLALLAPDGHLTRMGRSLRQLEGNWRGCPR